MKLTVFANALFLGGAHAWGSLGHETVAYVASNFVAPSTRTHFQTILHNTSDHYLAGVATWADSFRYTSFGRFSAPFHFIDAEDNPPSSCGVKMARDCGEKGCVVAAIQNYTSQLLDPETSAGYRNMAAKFIIHFLGDIHQPLHVENLDIGGNTIPVLFDSKPVNLHHVWDTSIPEKLIGGYSLPFAQAWAAGLTTAIKTGIYQDVASTWTEGIDLLDPVSSSLVWAEESNAYVCTHVLPNGVDGVNGTELGGSYYEVAVPVVQIQVARAGYRLAKWLDLIVEAVSAKPEL